MSVHHKQDRAAPFAATTLSTSDFRWLHQEGWEDYHTEYFAVSRDAIPLLISQRPPIQRKRAARNLCSAARWVLEDTKNLGTPIAWAEAHLHVQGFSQTTLHVAFDPKLSPSTESKLTTEALGFLISGCFILSSADLVTVVPFGDVATRLGAQYSILDAKPRLTFRSDEWVLPAASKNTLVLTNFAVSRIAWKTSSQGQKSTADLGYLEKRLKERVIAPPKYVRGIFGIPFRRRRCC